VGRLWRNVFDRYNIIDEDDLAVAGKRFWLPRRTDHSFDTRLCALAVALPLSGRAGSATLRPRTVLPAHRQCLRFGHRRATFATAPVGGGAMAIGAAVGARAHLGEIIENHYRNRCRDSRAKRGKLKYVIHMRMWRNWQTRRI
jgi:hypothetical protein